MLEEKKNNRRRYIRAVSLFLAAAISFPHTVYATGVLPGKNNPSVATEKEGKTSGAEGTTEKKNKNLIEIIKENNEKQKKKDAEEEKKQKERERRENGNWNDDEKDDAIATLEVTDWAEYQKYLTFGDIVLSAAGNKSVIDKKVEKYRKDVDKVVHAKTGKKYTYCNNLTASRDAYTEILLGMIQVLAEENGVKGLESGDSESPQISMKTFMETCLGKIFDPSSNASTVQDNIAVLFNAYGRSVKRQIEAQKKADSKTADDATEASPYDNNASLLAVVQGVVEQVGLETNDQGYSSQYEEYTEETAQSYLDSNYDAFQVYYASVDPYFPDPSFASDFGSIYTASNGSYSNGSIQVNGKSKQKFIQIITAQKGKRYVWGTRGPDTFDCSGLVWYGLHNCGYPLRGNTYRSTREYPYTFMKSIGTQLTKAQPGDIMWRDGHVGVFINYNPKTRKLTTFEAKTKKKPLGYFTYSGMGQFTKIWQWGTDEASSEDSSTEKKSSTKSTKTKKNTSTSKNSQNTQN